MADKSANYYKAYARKMAQKYGIDPRVFVRQINQESGFNPKAGSGAGAQGIAQIMPKTAQSWGVDPWKPKAALEAAAKNMKYYVNQYNGSYEKALAAYNAGPGAVAKYNGVPPFAETQHYVSTIMGGIKNPTTTRTRTSGGSRPTPKSPSGLTDAGREWLTSYLYPDDPVMSALLGKSMEPIQSIDTSPQPQSAGGAPAGTARPSRGYGSFRQVENRFGLARSSSDNDAPGVHVSGSDHYRKFGNGHAKAYDYGDAKNNPAKLRKLGQYLKKNYKTLGVDDFFYDPLGWYIDEGRVVKGRIGGHGDHAHLSF